MRIDVRKSPELQAIVLTLRGMRRDLRPEMNKAIRSRVGSLWLPALQRRASDRLTQAVILKGARVKVTRDGFALTAATSRKTMRGGFEPSLQWHAVEFGARRRRVTIQQRSRSGNLYSRTMVINRQLPGRLPYGAVAFDAASEVGTKAVTIWVTTIVDYLRTIADRVTPGRS